MRVSIFTQKYLHKCKYTYSMLQNKYLCIYKVNFEVKYLPRDDCGLSMSPHLSIIDLNICKMAKIALKKLCT